jgi:hypothetical protein
MANVDVTLDVTGFYFSQKVNVPEDSTIKDVMIAVVAATYGTDTEFTFSPHVTGYGEFCRMISIRFQKMPLSRQFAQNGTRFQPPGVSKGVYEFDDYTKDNQFANPQLAWQYYIVAEDGTGTLRSGEVGGKRTVVPFSRSNSGNGSVPKLQQNDRIIWRLVAICQKPTRPFPEESLAMNIDDPIILEQTALPMKYQSKSFGVK